MKTLLTLATITALGACVSPTDTRVERRELRFHGIVMVDSVPIVATVELVWMGIPCSSPYHCGPSPGTLVAVTESGTDGLFEVSAHVPADTCWPGEYAVSVFPWPDGVIGKRELPLYRTRRAGCWPHEAHFDFFTAF